MICNQLRTFFCCRPFHCEPTLALEDRQRVGRSGLQLEPVPNLLKLNSRVDIVDLFPDNLGDHLVLQLLSERRYLVSPRSRSEQLYFSDWSTRIPRHVRSRECC